MSEIDTPPEPLQRLKSRIAGLDAVLGGGFLQGGIYIVMGQPGAGKTIMGNQICFGHVAAGGRAVYVTLLAESHGRMLAHLQSLKFFSRQPIPEQLCYVSGYNVLEKDGFHGLLDLLRRVIRNQDASLLIIDGLVTAEVTAGSELVLKKFIHELQVLVGVVGCTVFLLMNNTDRDKPYPEHTMVDGLVELSDQVIGLRAVRELWVRKFRGSGYLRGRHFFEITESGIVVHPRIEAVYPAHAQAGEDRVRLTTGIADFDQMLHGGILSGSTTLLLGSPGTGKTLLGLKFLCSGGQAGEPGLYFGFYETPPRLIGKADQVGMNLGALVTGGHIEIQWQAPIEQLLDKLANQLLATIERRRVRRLFIDGLGGIRDAAVHRDRIHPFLVALTNELRKRNVTTLLSEEAPSLSAPRPELPEGGVSAIVENIVTLRYVEAGPRLCRQIAIRKLRESGYDATVRDYQITDRGIEIAAHGDLVAGLSAQQVSPGDPDEGPPQRVGPSDRGR